MGMARDWKKNTVYLAVYHQARGVSPILPFEGFVVAMVGLAGLLCAGLLLAICAAVAALCCLFAWRMAENDRADYGLVFVRRLQQRRRCYNALERDSAGAYQPPFSPMRDRV